MMFSVVRDRDCFPAVGSSIRTHLSGLQALDQKSLDEFYSSHCAAVAGVGWRRVLVLSLLAELDEVDADAENRGDDGGDSEEEERRALVNDGEGEEEHCCGVAEYGEESVDVLRHVFLRSRAGNVAFSLYTLGGAYATCER